MYSSKYLVPSICGIHCNGSILNSSRVLFWYVKNRQHKDNVLNLSAWLFKSHQKEETITDVTGSICASFTVAKYLKISAV